MKKVFYLIMLLATLMSCEALNINPFEKEVVELETPEEVLISEKDNSAKIRFNTKESWSIVVSNSKTNDSWLSVEPMSGGAGAAAVTVTVKPNVSTISRTSNITINSGDEQVTLKIEQVAATLIVLPAEIESTQDGGEYELKLTADSTWSVEKSVDWITLSANSGEKITNENFKFTVDANQSTESRVGTIKFTKGDISRSSIITQAGKAEVLGVAPENIQAVSEEASYKISLSASHSWTAATSEEWIVLSANSGVATDIDNNGNKSKDFTFSVLSNSGLESRSGMITFTMGSFTKDVIITQSEKGQVLTLNPDNLEIVSEAASYTVGLTASHSWSATKDADWITLPKGSGEATDIGNNGEISENFEFAVESNTDSEPRVGTITFTMGDSVKILVVKQLEKKSFLDISPLDIEVGSESGSHKVTVMASEAWRILKNVDWIKLTATSGVATDINGVEYFFNVEPNSRVDSREGEITFRMGDSTRKVKVTQLGIVPALTVTPNEISVGSEKGSHKVTITANVSWSVTKDVNWISFTETSGKETRSEGDDFNFSVDYNGDLGERVGTLTFKVGDITKTVVITQAGKSQELKINQTNINTTSNKSTQFVTLTASHSWSATTDVEWIKLSKSAGDADDSYNFYFDIEENDLDGARSGKITFKMGALTKEITVLQAEKVKMFVVTPNNINARSFSDYYTIQINASHSWTVDNKTSWITFSSRSGSAGDNKSINITLTSNPYYYERIDTLVFTMRDLTQEVIVKQEAKATVLWVETQNVTTDSKASNYSIALSASEAWSAESDAEWLKLGKLSGNETYNYNFAFSVDPNTSFDAREASIVFTMGELTQTVKVIQKGKEISISVTPENMEIKSVEGTYKITFSVDADWTVATDVDWITLDKKSGSAVENEVLSFNVTSNTTNKKRVGAITIKAGSTTKTINISQTIKQLDDFIIEEL